MIAGKHWSVPKTELATSAPVNGVMWRVDGSDGRMIGSVGPCERWIDARTAARAQYGEAAVVPPLSEQWGRVS